jgi:uncharacterized BrkB/YihY/UPF0761 family membrane protein
MTMPYRQNTPRAAYREDEQRLALVAGMFSGLIWTLFLLVLYGLAVLVADNLFGLPAIQAAHEGAHLVGRHRWMGGLLIGFLASIPLLASGRVRRWCQLTVKQYWTAMTLLATLCLVASFALHSLR